MAEMPQPRIGLYLRGKNHAKDDRDAGDEGREIALTAETQHREMEDAMHQIDLRDAPENIGNQEDYQ